jgi:hypothetical protein
MRRGGRSVRHIEFGFARWIIVVLVTLRAATASGQAPAQTPAQTPDAAARRALDEGNRALREHRVAAAATAFEESYRLRPSPVVLLSLAQAYATLGRHLAAIDAFERYIASPPSGVDTARLTALRAEVARLRATLVPVSITLRPAGATMSVDGRPQTASAGVVTLDPGAHVLEFAAEGYRTRREEVRLVSGSPQALAIDLEFGGARLELHSSAPGASFAIDGQSVSGSGVVTRDLPVGAHTVVVRAPGYSERRQTLQLAQGLRRVDVELDREGRWHVPAAGAAAGVVLVGTVILVGVLASGSGAYRSTWGNFNE